MVESLDDSASSVSKNDIFTASWRAAPPPPLPISSNTSQGQIVVTTSLGRSKTTGALSQWRANKNRTWLDLGSEKDLEVIDPRRTWDDSNDHNNTLQSTTNLDARDHNGDSTTDQHVAAKEPPAPLRLNRTKSFFESPLRHRHHSPVTPSPTYAAYDNSPTSPDLTHSTGTSSASTTTTHSTRNPSLSVVLPNASKLMPSSEEGVIEDSTFIEAKYFPTSTFAIGSGRYSTVFLGAWRSRGTEDESRRAEDKESSRNDWQICALKRLEDDEESQSLGLREVWFLRHMAAVGASHKGSAYVARLIGTKRECQVTAQIPETSLKHRTSKGFLNFVDYTLSELPKLRHSRHLSLEEHSHSPHSPSHASFASQQQNHPLDDRLFLILEYAPTTLFDMIHNLPHRLTKRQHTTIAHQLSLAVSFLHSQGILHTDIKPHNVLITPRLDVRLADFNTAIHMPSLPPSMLPPDDPVGLGTPPYSPPEFNKPPPSTFSFPSDIWALGVSLMVAIVGREPYERLATARRSHELKLWLKRGAYWAWEEQQRLDALEYAATKMLSRLNRTELEKPKIGEEQLRAILGDSYRPDQSLQQVTLAPLDKSLSTHSPAQLDSRAYDDSSPALYYLGSPDRVSQRLFELLQKMCSFKPESRPVAEDVVSVLQEEIDEMA
ncbi:hypothetical protein FRC02_008386 [Tulasnella sp. 418]|nr:hypothetical protein FRC02_008386 [Tulasnella sp. 418]